MLPTDLGALLRKIAGLVEAGDSAEGNMQWLLADAPGEIDVVAVVRTAGGIEIIGEHPDDEPPPGWEERAVERWRNKTRIMSPSLELRKQWRVQFGVPGADVGDVVITLLDALDAADARVDAKEIIIKAGERTIASADEALRTLREEWWLERERLRAAAAALDSAKLGEVAATLTLDVEVSEVIAGWIDIELIAAWIDKRAALMVPEVEKSWREIARAIRAGEWHRP